MLAGIQQVGGLLTASDSIIVRFLAEEVEHQGYVSGTHSFYQRVVWYEQAWHFAQKQKELTIPLIRHLGQLIEPDANPLGFRDCGVTVGGRTCPPPAAVPALITQWYSQLTDVDPLYAYYRFEEIHPFRDGNGRVGKIIYNALLGRLNCPEFPPQLWEIGPA